MSTHNICFHGEIRKNISTFGLTYLREINYFIFFFFTFIDHKSGMTQIDSFEFISL